MSHGNRLKHSPIVFEPFSATFCTKSENKEYKKCKNKNLGTVQKSGIKKREKNTEWLFTFACCNLNFIIKLN